MSTKSSYSAAEWDAIAGLPGMAMAAAAVSDGVGLLETVREMNAGVHAIEGGSAAHAGNELIQAIIADLTTPEGGTAPDAGTPEVVGTDRDPEGFLVGVIGSAAQVRDILAAKSTTDEAAGYKAWVLDVVTRVIERTRHGGLLGIGGDQIDRDEADFRDDLAEALGR